MRAPQEAASAASPGFNSSRPRWPRRLVNLQGFLSLECEAAGRNLRDPCCRRATRWQVAFGFRWVLAFLPGKPDLAAPQRRLFAPPRFAKLGSVPKAASVPLCPQWQGESDFW